MKKLIFTAALLAAGMTYGQMATPNGTVTATTNPTTGNVGIGTTTPTQKLDVSGVIRTSSSFDKKIQFSRIGGNGFSIEHDTGKLYFYNESTEQVPLSITNSSNIGIGTANPTQKLDIVGNTRIQNPNGYTTLYLNSNGTGNYAGSGLCLTTQINNPTTSSFASTQIITHRGADGKAAFEIQRRGTDINNYLGTLLLYTDEFGWDFRNAPTSTVMNTNQSMRISKEGKVSIGTGNSSIPTTAGSVDVSNYKLFVNGGVLANEIRVRTGWADYVFAKDYALKPIAEVEKFIASKGHLPNVPSAAEVADSGINVGDMARIQQEKIEELMLYIIQQNKRIEALEARVNRQ
ncbi:hypothetical protein [Flavobacterium branchiophilum]|uniref:Endosialidase-like protein n=1 Tax=Flavobacterium branchiophilum TaxID=55197 RepID=A0A2H3KA97_9FLAO|nr:hypothetical protein [Flavobacterium branchiophilum]PDS23418.1 hypothetical protein B0A77_10975 [Flavobacterium branchiophilum]